MNPKSLPFVQLAKGLAIAALLSLVFALAPRSQVFRGSLLVQVVDSSGAALPAASVTIDDRASATNLTQSSDTRGEARFVALSPATYTLTAAARGFATKSAVVTVAVGSHRAVRITLAPESLKELVEVHDRGPSLASQPLETTSSAVQTVVTSDDLDEIPLSARSFANIAIMAPFTAPVEPSDPTKARITAVSFGG